jgi:hypothetical protein
LIPKSVFWVPSSGGPDARPLGVAHGAAPLRTPSRSRYTTTAPASRRRSGASCVAGLFSTIGQVQPLDRGREVEAKDRLRFRGSPSASASGCVSLSANISVVEVERRCCDGGGPSQFDPQPTLRGAGPDWRLGSGHHHIAQSPARGADHN